MQDSGASFPKDGRHVVGVGDGPAIYKSDAVTKAVVYADASVTLQAGVALVVTDGIAQSAIQANAATSSTTGYDAGGVTIAVAGGTTTAATATLTSAATAGQEYIWITTELYASADNNDVKLEFQIDQLNNGTWVSFVNVHDHLYVKSGAAATNHTSFSFMQTHIPVNNNQIHSYRVKITNNHATATVTTVQIFVHVFELRR